MKTIGVLCGGFGGVEIGAMEAGIKPVWSIEIDPAIAVVVQSNLDHKIIVANILSVDPHTMEAVYILHISPPCRFFSQGNPNRGETEQDIVLARKTIQFIKILKPRIFTLENVWLYRKSKSWQIIRDALYECGYWLDLAHVNSADFGVPQTRKRMIVRAIRGAFVPYLPQPEPWRGWYDAIEDLIPELPESPFAPWQLVRLPDELKILMEMTNKGGEMSRGFIADSQNGNRFGGDGSLTIRRTNNPIFSITNQYKGPSRAWLSQGRIVSITPRCMARFQTLPDWYALPESNKLACKGIGNLMPSLWYEKIARGLIAN